MLKYLSLVNYRNHSKFNLQLAEITILIGKNGVGKTNVLEAVGLLSSCRSFRGDNRLNLIRFDNDFCRVNAELILDDKTKSSLEIFIQQSPRLSFQAKERGIKRKVADFIGILPSVIFSPESLNIIVGEPKERRRFLDVIISQKDHVYLRALQDYKKVLSQRNGLLKMIADGQAGEDQLDFWDDELAATAKIITVARKQAVGKFSKFLSDFYRTISGSKKSSINLIYRAKGDGNFSEKLLARRSIDIAAGLTTSGPHRDDLQFKLDSLEAEKYASRGELRSIILALKMAELKYLENGSKPILLLDDIFSEFDADHQAHLYDLIKNYQTVLTTTGRQHLSKELLTKALIIEVGKM
ncbi:hypothetical protein COT12_03260 [Candidatus Berkelbacteria bacterium CG08_land_8_20_14_0_20_39_8]|uniref:DNA replication and repair protein RecF n=1 Tax=Candidatus Berkelbacteria bacterium CG08_land_8_20_14_0_20_39_8 TaxID=1974511 RepID=A0A2M6YBF4_9BACT|nr:MAG: hypothetical protein COT12_03260 [Candidatus Berkelbacteria bacterium CG08_land_8_20_14_0_20_39_8]